VNGRGFGRYWIGETISEVGSQITLLALPLTAITVLGAGPAEVGALATAGFLPYLLVGPFAGVIVDRLPRRPLLAASYVASAALLLTIPMAALAGLLTLGQLLLIAFAVQAIVVVTSVANQAILPSLVPRETLVLANARLQGTISAAAMIGPALGGLLVQVLRAPLAMAADAASFLVAAGLVASTRPIEPAPSATHAVRREIVAGLRLVLRDPRLRGIVECGAIHNFCSRGIDALFVLYLTQTLGLSPVATGVAIAVAGPGAVIGSAVTARISRRLGAGPLLIGAQLLGGFAQLLVGLASGGPIGTLLMLGGGLFLLGVSRALFNITQVSLRQAIAGDALQGRVNGSIRFLIWSVTPFGAAAAGVLASGPLGIRGTIVVAASGIIAATIPLLRKSLRGVNDPATERALVVAPEGRA
jgi:predicted MFS family arabinose efflux permease